MPLPSVASVNQPLTPQLPPVQPELTSIVMLTHNQWPTTAACLESLFANTTRPFELIVVDNASSDETPQKLRELAERDERVTFIRNDENRGFPAGNNQGLSVCRGEYVLLLNNDTLLPSGWLERLIRPLADDTIGIAGPVTNYASKRQVVDSVEIDALGGYRNVAALSRFAERWHDRHAGELEDTSFVIGFCMLFRRTLLETVGGLDEAYAVGNYEDDDLCVRCRNLSLRCVVVRDCFVHHEGSKSFNSAGKSHYSMVMQRNLVVFGLKWHLRDGERSTEFALAPGTYPADYGAQSLPDISRDHVQHTPRIWTPVPAAETILVRPAWSPAGAEAVFLAETAATLSQRATVIVIPAGATTTSPAAVVMSALELLAVGPAGAGAVAAVVADIVHASEHARALVAAADLVLCRGMHEHDQLTAAGIPAGIIRLVSDPGLAEELLRLHDTAPVRSLLPATVEARTTLLLLGDPVEGNGGWRRGFAAYLQAVAADDDVTLAVPISNETADTVASLLEQELEHLGTDPNTIGDVCLVNHDGSPDALQLAAAGVIAADPATVRRAVWVQPTAEAVRAFAG